MKKYILAIDLGSTFARSIIFDKQFFPIFKEEQSINPHFLSNGHINYNLEKVWDAQLKTILKVMSKVNPKEIAAIGIANQRQTTAMWDKNGNSVCEAISWQCQRTIDICKDLTEQGLESEITAKTGTILSTVFAGPKIKWLLENIDGLAEKAINKEILFGTLDSWLIYKLTSGRLHITDYSNVSSTMIFDIHNRQWDSFLLDLFSIPPEILPQVVPSSQIYGTTSSEIIGAEIPIAGIAGDQQASLFGHACFEKSTLKNTYGTGGFTLVNTGSKAIPAANGLISEIAWVIEDQVTYALEGVLPVSGAVIKWLKEQVKIIKNISDSEKLAFEVNTTEGVYFVPALAGIGTPYWDMNAKGTICGLTFGTNTNHIIRAALEGMCYQTRDLIEAITKLTAFSPKKLRIDGGASNNKFICQFQADILGIPVEKSTVADSTALGVAYLAGLAVGFCKSTKDIQENWRCEQIFSPQINEQDRELQYQGWKNAVAKTRLH
ncbi:FGGY family carbohydrate kinase [Candidatus Uabimicrobium sp. HlEnr_7]|uniref:FGGY family carbohydrate kinase n=1 Tax=Candidatus Uabimicrobium helgolandensis TaxID=3095367 RepID=UPI003556539C